MDEFCDGFKVAFFEDTRVMVAVGKRLPDLYRSVGEMIKLLHMSGSKMRVMELADSSHATQPATTTDRGSEYHIVEAQ